MGLAQDLQARGLELRKQRSDIAPGFQTVLGFAQASAKERGLKGGDATVNDEDAQRAIQRGIKMCNDTLETAPGDDRTLRERAALEDLLPEMADEMEVRAEVGRFIGGNPQLIGDKKAMGEVMKFLNERFGASLNKAEASKIAREALVTA